MKLEWLVPVIVAIVYVIGWIIKAKEEIDAKAKKPVNKAPGQELDRFLQEIERLRKQNEAAPKPEARTYDEQGEIVRPVVVRPSVKPPAVVPPPPVVPRARPVPAAQPAPQPVFAVTQPEDRPRPGMSLARSAKPGSLSPPLIPRHTSVGRVMTLLRNPETISTALMLQAILGPPKSKQG